MEISGLDINKLMMRMYFVKYFSLKFVLLYNYEFYGFIIISVNKIK